MGKVYTLNSTECITSDDVTAKKSNVLAGTKTITSDSDNVIVNGTMPDNTTRTSNGSRSTSLEYNTLSVTSTS